MYMFWILYYLLCIFSCCFWSYCKNNTNIVMLNFPRIFSFIRSSICPFIHSFIHSSIYPSIHPSIHSFIHSFIHSIIHSFICVNWWNLIMNHRMFNIIWDINIIWEENEGKGKDLMKMKIIIIPLWHFLITFMARLFTWCDFSSRSVCWRDWGSPHREGPWPWR